MPRKRRAGKERKAALTHDQAMALLFGDCNDPGAFTSPHPHLRSAFASPFVRAAAWHQHKDGLMAEWDAPGTRPWAFYEYELGEHPPGVGTLEEAAFLQARGLLTAEEEAQLKAIASRPSRTPRPVTREPD